MKFENILEETGGCGCFQFLIITLVCIPQLIIPFHFLLNNFIAAVPAHHCDFSALDDTGVIQNLTQEQRLTVSLPVQEDGTPSSCKMFLEPQFHLLTNSNDSDQFIVPCQIGWVYDNSTFKSTIVTEWDLVCDSKSLNKATGTFFFVGVMVGAIAFGTLTDKFGRKPMLLVSYILAMVFGFTSAFSTSYTMFIVMRFFTGFGLTGISIISSVLSVEWVDIKHRSLIVISGTMAWSIGNILLAGIAYQVNDWRWLMIAVSLPLSLAIVTWCPLDVLLGLGVVTVLPPKDLASGQARPSHILIREGGRGNRRGGGSAGCLPSIVSSHESSPSVLAYPNRNLSAWVEEGIETTPPRTENQEELEEEYEAEEKEQDSPPGQGTLLWGHRQRRRHGTLLRVLWTRRMKSKKRRQRRRNRTLLQGQGTHLWTW